MSELKAIYRNNTSKCDMTNQPILRCTVAQEKYNHFRVKECTVTTLYEPLFNHARILHHTVQSCAHSSSILLSDGKGLHCVELSNFDSTKTMVDNKP